MNVENIEMRRLQFPFGLAGFLFLLGLAGLVTIASAGTEKYDYDALGRLTSFFNPQGLITRYTYDGVGNIREVQVGLQPQPPVIVIGSVSPAQIRRGASQQITIESDALYEMSGTNITTPDAYFSISGLQISGKQITFLLGASELAQLGSNTFKVTGSAGSSSFAVIVNPSLPILEISPIPIAIPPNNTPYKFIVRLGSQDNIDHTITLSTADTNIAQLASTTVTILAGSTEVTTEIAGRTDGGTSLSASSTGLQSIAIPVYVTENSTAGSANFSLGVTYGPVALSASVDTPIMGSNGTLIVSGSELNGVNKFTISPADGITLGGTITVSADGKQASVPISFASSATVGLHQIALSVNTTRVPFVQAGSDRFFLAAGLPHIDSIDPILIHKGESIILTIRGQNLTAVSNVVIEPAADISVVSLPVVNASGTEITVSLTVAAGAASGARVIRVVTPAGMTDAAPSPSNTLTILQ